MTQMDKSISSVALFSIGFGAIVGIGWLTLTGFWINDAGPLGASIAFLMGGTAVAVIGLNYAAIAQKYPIAGGEMAYAERIFGHKTSQLTGSLLLLLFLSVCAFEGISVAWVISVLIPASRNIPIYQILGHDVYEIDLVVAVLVTCALTMLNVRGTHLSSRIQDVLVGLFIFAALVFVSLGFASSDSSNLQPLIAASDNGDQLAGVLKVLAITPFMYAGFNCIPQALPDANSATIKTLPRIILLAILASGIFYVLVIFATGGLMQRTDLLEQGLPVAGAMEVAFNSKLAANIVLSAGLFGLLTTWNAMFFASSRLLAAMGENRLLPPVLAVKDTESNAPRVAIYLTAAITGAVMFLGRGFIEPIVNTVSAIVSLMFLVVCLGLAKENIDSKSREIKQWITPFLGIIISITLLSVTLYGHYESRHYTVPLEWSILIMWTVLLALVGRIITTRLR
jgi:amino acid transporter